MTLASPVHATWTSGNRAPLRVAIIHDWMFQRRGGERVVEHLLGLFPQATLFLMFGKPESCLVTERQHPVVLSGLAKIPFIEKFYKILLPLFPIATEGHDLSGFDLVISSSSCAAKGVIAPPGAVHVCYMHSPMRYAWDMERSYFDGKPKALLLRPLSWIRRWLLSRLRTWDVASAARVDVFCANSDFVRRRIELYYRRQATVVYPPVDLERFHAVRLKRKPLQRTVLLFGAWVPYKRMDWALEGLHRRLSSDIVIVAAGHGEGFESARKHLSTTPRIQFISSPDAAQVDALYEKAHVLAFPGTEDFGIVPVEAMAAGVWVVGPRAGGTRETIKEGVTGFSFEPHQGDEGVLDDMAAAINHALAQPSPPAEAGSQNHLAQFSKQRFNTAMATLCREALQTFARIPAAEAKDLSQDKQPPQHQPGNTP